MSHFRLRGCDKNDSPDNAGPIPFPMFGPLDAADPTNEDAADRALRLAHDIEHTLDEVQRRLDTVKDHLDDAFRLPDPDDWPPTAA
jgi:hypothetical protein